MEVCSRTAEMKMRRTVWPLEGKLSHGREERTARTAEWGTNFLADAHCWCCWQHSHLPARMYGVRQQIPAPNWSHQLHNRKTKQTCLLSRHLCVCVQYLSPCLCHKSLTLGFFFFSAITKQCCLATAAPETWSYVHLQCMEGQRVERVERICDSVETLREREKPFSYRSFWKAVTAGTMGHFYKLFCSVLSSSLKPNPVLDTLLNYLWGKK